jgi:excisionase family DNA binding protein
MKTRPTKFGVRENTASARQHALRGVMNASLLPSDALFGTEQQDKRTRELTSPIKESFELSFTETDKGATGGRDSGTITGALLGDGKLSVVERPLTCQEAAAFVRVHPRTVKRMARAGKVPGHFRFGRWYFYASELDCWMRMELHSARQQRETFYFPSSTIASLCGTACSWNRFAEAHKPKPGFSMK